MEIKLQYPIETPNGKVEVINLRRIKISDIRAVDSFKNDSERELHLFARISGLTIEDLEELDLSDYAKFQESFKEMMEGKSRA